MSVLDRLIAEAWLATMREHSNGHHFNLLPSEAATMVGKVFGVEPHVVLIAVATNKASEKDHG